MGHKGNAMACAEDYRHYAAQCLALAQRAQDQNDRARLLEMARAFNELSAKAASQKDEDRK
jgi:hypothetical protein